MRTQQISSVTPALQQAGIMNVSNSKPTRRLWMASKAILTI
ncbi:hypothetical protein MAR_004464 [Mya arenaria]|uniref:Uncharacterized protein n=1 Tax=Mya arenaria TaxID=6604 RepID=A0ABY7F0U0_MYAAR|nr:hypothetical protein MAR_004464 [Mya arenaria]